MATQLVFDILKIDSFRMYIHLCVIVLSFAEQIDRVRCRINRHLELRLQIFIMSLNLSIFPSRI